MRCVSPLAVLVGLSLSPGWSLRAQGQPVAFAGGRTWEHVVARSPPGVDFSVPDPCNAGGRFRIGPVARGG